MAHFVKLDDANFVIEVQVISNEVLDVNNEETSGITFLTDWSGGYTNWKQTSYNGKIRKQYAGIGFYYDSTNDVFIAPKPYESWLLDANFDWQPPKPKPDNGRWNWDEQIGDWVEAETL